MDTRDIFKTGLKLSFCPKGFVRNGKNLAAGRFLRRLQVPGFSGRGLVVGLARELHPQNLLLHLLAPIFQTGEMHFCFLGVGRVDSLAVVAKGLLRESLRKAALAGALGPGITVAMQGDARNPQAMAALPKFVGPVLLEATPIRWGKSGPLCGRPFRMAVTSSPK